ncbi:MAG: winged helix-turn-helix domain-containing protein [Planctomycetota bacterium]|jgi:DNA-binding MarR family transcriptional regulator
MNDSIKPDDIDPVIHERVRLSIVSALAVAPEMSFNELKSTLGLSDGNLSAHATSLQKAGYIEIAKTFKANRPHTTMRLTPIGQKAFQGYVEKLRKLINKPDEPMNEQNQATDKTDEPMNEQDQPTNKPDEPMNEQDQAMHKPDQTIDKQDQVMHNPDQSTNNPDESMHKPDESMHKPDESMHKPDQTIDEQDQAMNKPDESMHKPDQTIAEQE